MNEDEFLSSVVEKTEDYEISDNNEDRAPIQCGSSDEEDFTALETVMSWCEW